MKKGFDQLVTMIFIVGVFAMVSCGNNNNEVEFTDGFWLKMGDHTIVPTSDIDYYDVSQHTIYLKKSVPYLKIVHGTVSVYVGNDVIYECSIHSAICSHIPMGQPYIYDISSNGEKINIVFNPFDEQ